MPIMNLSMGSGARSKADDAAGAGGSGKLGEDFTVGGFGLGGAGLGGVGVLAADVVGAGSVGATSAGV